jgi:hypothetical protein
MTVDWTGLFKTLGSTAIIVAALAWLSKALFNYLLSRDIERFKVSFAAELKNKYDKELEQFKANITKELEQFKTNTTVQGLREERIRKEIIRWANPILGAVQELNNRLDNILNYDGYLALSKNYEQQINTNWSISYDYFMPSTLYLFGQYFCWIRLLQEQLNFELFETQEEKDTFFSCIRKVSKSLGSFPPLYACNGKDTQVFTFQQRGIGEALIIRESEGSRCMTYHEFLEKMEEPLISYHLAPLRILLEGLNLNEDCRWKRLKATRDTLYILEDYCEELLQLKKTNQQ